MNVLAYVHLRNICDSTGAGRVARNLVENLAGRSGVAVRILADRSDYDRVLPRLGSPWRDYGYRFFENETSWQQARWLFTNRPPAERYWPETQIIFCTAESYVPKTRSRLVVTLHDAAYFEQDVHARSAAFLKQRWKWRYLYRVLARQSDLFHTVSNFSAERIAHFFPQLRTRLRVVYNAVTPLFFKPPTESGLEFLRAAKLTDRPFIHLPGGLSHRKNAGLVLCAWKLLHARHPELKLVITGHCQQEFLPAVETMADSVSVLGFISDDRLRAVYHAAQLTWFPSRYEGFGIPVLESMACGTPVVASNCSSLPEVVDKAGVLVPPDSPGDHVDALSGLLKNASARNELRSAALERARRFTWEQSANELVRNFAALV